MLSRRYSRQIQYFISITTVLFVSLVCFYSSSIIGYRIVALLLLMTVSLLAMLFDIIPVLVAAFLSALIWNFFFIYPLYTFHIHNAEDLLMFILYFVIALVNAVLTFRIRIAEKKARDKEEKENTIKLYNTLLNSLSHELRTPIATIIGAVDALKESKEKFSVNIQNELLSQIDLASIRLNREVENLLNMSRLESGMLKINLDWCDVNELIYSVIQKLTPNLDNRHFDFDPNLKLPLFKLDIGLIEQTLYNIIYNALQYTPETAEIKIEALHHSDQCKISIEDNGPGFPTAELESVFEKFYRLPNTKPGGSGLGLSIAKGFVEAHNGSIRLENKYARGSKFIISIPADTSFLNNLKNE